MYLFLFLVFHQIKKKLYFKIFNKVYSVSPSSRLEQYLNFYITMLFCPNVFFSNCLLFSEQLLEPFQMVWQNKLLSFHYLFYLTRKSTEDKISFLRETGTVWCFRLLLACLNVQI